MSISLWQGYITNGFLSNWAFINKYIGFFVLLSYLVLGAWISTNQEHNDVFFARVFSLFFIFILLLSTIALIFGSLFPSSFWIENYPWDGIMANRNAFMVLAIFVVILMETYRYNNTSLFPHWVYNITWYLMPFFAMFNASRTAWIIGAFVLLALTIKSPFKTLRHIGPYILIGTVLCFISTSVLSLKNSRQEGQLSRITSMMQGHEISYEGDKKRLIDMKEGLDLYKKSNPIIGAGLGAYYEHQKAHRNNGRYLYVIDFTTLWLLVETGILGLLTFSAFFIFCMLIFYQKGFKDEKSCLHQALFFFFIAFAAISVLHEIMYTRFVWFALGLGLASAKPLKP